MANVYSVSLKSLKESGYTRGIVGPFNDQALI